MGLVPFPKFILIPVGEGGGEGGGRGDLQDFCINMGESLGLKWGIQEPGHDILYIGGEGDNESIVCMTGNKSIIFPI